MKYAIRQTYTDHVTGEHWTRVPKKRWFTRRGAEKVAQRDYAWATMPDGKTIKNESSAEVIEVTV